MKLYSAENLNASPERIEEMVDKGIIQPHLIAKYCGMGRFFEVITDEAVTTCPFIFTKGIKEFFDVKGSWRKPRWF